jgi:hypothetical protein
LKYMKYETYFDVLRQSIKDVSNVMFNSSYSIRIKVITFLRSRVKQQRRAKDKARLSLTSSISLNL